MNPPRASWLLLGLALSACGPSVPLPEAQTRIKQVVDATVDASAPGVSREVGGLTGELHPCGFGIVVGMGERADYTLLFTLGESNNLEAVLNAVAESWAAQGFEVHRGGSQDVAATDGDFSYSAALLNRNIGRGRITGTTPCYY